MKYGKIIGESNSSYHENPCVSASTLKTFIKSPLLYYRKYIEKSVATDETPAMRLGSAVHEWVLEPDEFGKHYAVTPDDLKMTTKEGKAWKEKQTKHILKPSEFDEIQRLGDAVASHPIASVLLSHGEPEVSWRVKAGLYDMQSRTDWFIDEPTKEQLDALNGGGITINQGQPIVIDLKTTAELDAWFRENYGNAIHQFGYQLQLAFYLAVINKIRKAEGKEICRHFLFIVVEKKPPYDCAVIALSERSFQLAQTQLRHYLKRLTACYESGVWEGYRDRGILVTGVPERICEAEESDIFNEKVYENPANW